MCWVSGGNYKLPTVFVQNNNSKIKYILLFSLFLLIVLSGHIRQ